MCFVTKSLKKSLIAKHPEHMHVLVWAIAGIVGQ